MLWTNLSSSLIICSLKEKKILLLILMFSSIIKGAIRHALYFLGCPETKPMLCKTLNLNYYPIYTSNEDTKSQLFLLRNESAERTGKTCESDLDIFCSFAILSGPENPKIELFLFFYYCYQFFKRTNV